MYEGPCCFNSIDRLLMTVKSCRSARGAKVSMAAKMFAPYGDRVEIVNVNDIAVDDVSEHLLNVDAVIHSAAPMPTRVTDIDALEKVRWGFYSHARGTLKCLPLGGC